MPSGMFFLYLIILSICLAKLEIQIEGSGGWAGNLPTWKVRNRISSLFLGIKPFTGYHLFLHLTILLLSHLYFAIEFKPPSFYSELRILAFLIYLWVVEDFLWFLLNPAFGFKKFKAQYIWWHADSWWWIMPKAYWLALPIATALYLFSFTF